MKSKGWFILIFVLILLVSGCSTETKVSEEAVNDIILDDMAGEQFKLSDQTGKPVYVKFWASWCPVCLQSLPELEQLAADQADFEVITVVSPGHGKEMNTAEFRKWFDNLDSNNFRVLLDEGGKYAQKFGIRAYPTSLFVNESGSVKVLPGDIQNEMIKAIFTSGLLDDEENVDQDNSQDAAVNSSEAGEVSSQPEKIRGAMNTNSENTADIYLAGGCFWGVEAYFEKIEGVREVTVGYANGKTENPSYEDLIYNNSGHAETVHVVYDPTIVSLDEILQYYFRIINPTSVNQQGNDRGVQYRTGIYYVNDADKEVIDARIAIEQKKYEKQIAVEVMPLVRYDLAEDYHQDYLTKNPGGYCHIDLSLADQPLTGEPLINENDYPKPDAKTLKDALTAEQFTVTQNNGTEPSFNNAYWDFFEDGIYVDVVTGEPLFSSQDKFDSECGWPSFSKAIADEVVKYNTDSSYGMLRTEVRSRSGDSHLGHVFGDGPEELGGQRYCINSAAIRFVPLAEMESEGYGYLLTLFH